MTVTDRSPSLMHALASQAPLFASSVQHIRMTPEDLAAGIRGDAVNCPIAKVIRDHVSWIVAVDLSGPRPTFTDTFGLQHNLTLPQEVIDWIGRFDRGEAVDPLDITVSAV